MKINKIPIALCLSFLATMIFSAPVNGNTGKNDIKDDKITTAIERELFDAKQVNANDIDVNSIKGIVTLEGKVKHILTKDRAVRIAQMTKGVKSVIDKMSVKKTKLPDDQLRNHILDALAVDPATEYWEIDVKVDGGEVALGGKVNSFAEKELAAQVAKSVRGVTKLENNIGLDYKTERADYEIHNEIQQRLDWDVRLDDELIKVAVNEGEVALSGSVGSAYEKKIAASDAWVAGVEKVNDSKLKVAWWSRDKMQRKTAWKTLGDEKIEEAITQAFLYDPRVFSFNPAVQVDNGVVTLTGLVDNMKAKRAAAQDAKNTVGVRQVKNFLKVRPVDARKDAAIKNAVAKALRRDVLVDRYELSIFVDDGEVSLYGDVDSYFERAQAEDVATKVNGVTEINNHLQVSYDYPVYGQNFYDWNSTLYDYDFDYETITRKPDRQIKESIESELWWSPWVSYDQINVVVLDGVATLSGTVDTWNERQAAAENAIEGGAVKVVNRLDVDY